MLPLLPPTFAATRDALHALAEHVLAPARHRVDGHVGLAPTADGFGTPVFGDGERVRVEGGELVHERPGSVRRVAITTLADAATFVGVPLGAPRDVYKPLTECVPDMPLMVDADASRALGAWYAFVDSLLAELVTRHPTAASTAQLWPEHFDLACELGDRDAGTRANYGGSPGDAAIAVPYLYVGPWEAARRTGALGTHPWGAAITHDELAACADPRSAAGDFFSDRAALLVGAG